MKAHLNEGIIIELLETGNISEKDKKHLDSCRKCQEQKEGLISMLHLMDTSTEKDTPAHIRWAIDAAIQEELMKSKASNESQFKWIQIAASITLLLVGFFLGKGAGQSNQEIAELKEQVELLKEVTITSALKTHSASERIQAVNQIEGTNLKSNERLIKSLIETVNTDESPNVRYEAVQALNRFIDLEIVRAELVKSLDEQEDPLIQIAMIQILVGAQERSAVAPLRKIIESEQAIPEVKEQAAIAIEILI